MKGDLVKDNSNKKEFENTTQTDNLKENEINSLKASSEESNTKTEEFKKPLINTGIKKFLIIFAIVFFVLILLVVLYKFFIKPKNQSTSVNETATAINTASGLASKVEYATGEIWKIVEGRKVQVLEGDVLKEGDQIISGSGSKLVILFDDGSVVRIDENTNITLTSLKSAEMKLAQDSGVIFARVQKDENHTFIIDTGNFLVKSAGTAFSVEKKDQIKVSVFESSVEVNKDGQDIKVEEKQEWQEGMNQAKAMDEKKIAKNEFINWSLSEEKLTNAPTATPTKKPEANENTGLLNLKGEAVNTGIKLTWTVGNIDVSKGFKLVKNSSGSPKYPGDSAVYIEANTREYTWQIADGNTWHIRICQYTGGGCSVYSNEVDVKAPSATESSVKSISLSGNFVEGVAKLSWTVEGSSSMGYKVVWSKNAGPTYPSRDGDEFLYISNPDERSAKIDGLSAGWDYHIRVCEYLDGKCGIYSNEITLKY